MKMVLRRKTRKLRKLRFECHRCGTVFLADLHPDCRFKYDPFIRDMANTSKVQTFLSSFHSIYTTCPDCGETVSYGKQIPMKVYDGIEIT